MITETYGFSEDLAEAEFFHKLLATIIKQNNDGKIKTTKLITIVLSLYFAKLLVK
jgi:hypothetical protein